MTDLPGQATGRDAVATPGSLCVACQEPLLEGARFCEACGAPAGESADAGHEAPAAARSCASCGGGIDGDGYCTSCGHRALDPVAVEDQGTRAFATHRGRRHQRNEDAAALATTAEGWPVLVVSDGVSASPNPHRASAAAVAAAAARLAGRTFTGPDDLLAAVAAAHEAAAAVPSDGDPHWAPDETHPACTIVVAVAAGTTVHMANVGDARAHLLTPIDEVWAAVQLSTDDSVAAHAVSRGVEAEVALALPGGHGITAWLGADAPDVVPHVATRPAGPADVLLACSDGLWNYAPTDEAMGEVVTAAAPPAAAPLGSPAAVCERLVAWANDQGGTDNITVALAALASAAPAAAEPIELEENA